MKVQERADNYGVEWIEMDPDQWAEAKKTALEDLGMTWEELRQEAAGRNFRSYEAQQVWMVLGDPES